MAHPQQLTEALLEAHQSLPEFQLTTPMDLDIPMTGAEIEETPRKISGESERPLRPLGLGDTASRSSSVLGTKRSASSLGSAFLNQFGKLNFGKFKFTKDQKTLTADMLKSLPVGHSSRAGWEMIDGKIGRELEKTEEELADGLTSVASAGSQSSQGADEKMLRAQIRANKDNPGIQLGYKGLANSFRARRIAQEANRKRSRPNES